MIRVGFIIEPGIESWMGGVSYYANLLNALGSMPDRRIEPVILTGTDPDLPARLGLPSVEVVCSRLLNPSGFAPLFRRGYRRVLSYDRPLEQLLLRHRISVLSHSAYIGEGSRIPTIGWITDFQHRYLPDLFNFREIEDRELRLRAMCRYHSTIVVSSRCAQRDLAEMDPVAASKSVVLHFVAGFADVGTIPTLESLEQKYAFRGPYLYMPNQFWIHKNHRVVVDALRSLRDAGRRVLVVATGSTQDFRQPGHFEALMAHAQECGVSESWKVLGCVPREDVVGLLKHSIAAINPSLFEGWSTTVEEAKSIGKTLLLSDIATHREQAPPSCTYFDPRRGDRLAEAMWTAWCSHDPRADEERMRRAAEERPGRYREFAAQYQDIVLRSLADGKESKRQVHATRTASTKPAPPTISLVTPSFNQGRFLETTLESVLSQRYPALEYVVVDGGSTDDSVAVLRRHADRLSYWVSEKDAGQYDAINKGFARSTGEIMGWLNSDDFHMPWTLSVVAEIFSTFPEVEWLTTLFPLHADERGRGIHAAHLNAFHAESFLRGANLPAPRRPGARFIMQESTFWRRSLWERAGGRMDASLTYAADFELWARFFRLAPLVGVCTPLAAFRIHPQQKTSLDLPRYFEEAERVLHRYGKRPYGQTESLVRTALRRTFKNAAVSQFPRTMRVLHALLPSYRALMCVTGGQGRWELVETMVW